MGDIGSELSPKNIVMVVSFIGVSTAYWLSQPHFYDPSIHSITIPEATEIAGGSSGKAGGCNDLHESRTIFENALSSQPGLLAACATPYCLAPLSFKLHTELAEKYNGIFKWDFRRVHCADITYYPQNRRPESESIDILKTLDWINECGTKESNKIGRPENSTQAHPTYLVSYLLRLAQLKAQTLLLNLRNRLSYLQVINSTIDSVSYIQDENTKQIDATDAIIAAGPWSSKLVPRIPACGVRSHSIVMNPSRSLSLYVRFPIFDPLISEASPQYKEKDAME
ncbi:hypothetical protein DSL72_000420 [Monilinia vaccinii-corymbosi]|uniref:FAD dependent oxidoreductase domain-containing protein n=1 Tax=Monilinia vaccinii-corymbosi TaxID=61207 RepID=A0A8A3P1K3_9HELO|nr:hypothetical protein DSL72_000420 [Monilinia vaccinii-corymbosi]